MSEPLSALAFAAHLAACAALHPVVSEIPGNRAVATAQAESGLRPFAIGDNNTGRSYFLPTAAAATAKARELLALGHRIDAGLMQVTDRNWSAYGLTAETVFDPRANVCAGARILGEAFAIERRAHCRYNTGRAACANGYPERVDAAALRVAAAPSVPATPAPSPPVASGPLPVVLAACGPAPASWDGWALSAHEACAARAVLAPTSPRAPDANPSPDGQGAPSVVASNLPPERR